MKIYTRTGDQGETGLFAGPRVPKDDVRIEAYGTVDELNAVLGRVRADDPPGPLDRVLERVQHELFAVGAELATPDPPRHGTNLIGEAQIAAMEAEIDHWEQRLPPLEQFILPGGCKWSAGLHVARAVSRRAERRVTSLSRDPGAKVSPELLGYLNRLSDLLFVLARAANLLAAARDVNWQKPK